MRKNKLIELLHKIEGNPDIVLWNGIVGDYQNIDPCFVEGELVKKTLAEYIENCRVEQCVKLKDWEFKFSDDEINELKSNYKMVLDWEDNRFVTEEDIELKRYSKKRVVFIQSKQRGENFFCRGVKGGINY